MKKYLIFAATVAFALVSCVKENPVERQEEPVGLVKMTFRASIEADAPTRAFLASNGKSTEWEAGDEIAVFDNINNTIHKFVAESDGATTSFTGTVNEGATSFVAVYPYSDEIAYDSESDTPITADIPVIQEAVKGSFDPAAALFVASAENEAGVEDVIEKKFTFTPAFGLFKVTVDVDDVMALYVENTKIAMSGSVYTKTTGSLSNGPATTYKWISLQKEDGTSLEQGDYYIVSRFAGSNSLENFKLSYVKADAGTSTREAGTITSELFKRRSVANLGKLSDFPDAPAVSWYTYYQVALPISIGSRTIQRLTDGEAELLTADNAVTAIAKSKFEGGGVKFLKAVGTGTFSQTNNPTIAAASYILADGASPVQVDMTNVLNLADGALCMKGLKLTISGKTAFFTVNKNTSSSMAEFILDGCHVVQNVASFINTNSGFQTYGIRRIEMINNRFFVSTTANLVNVTSSYAGANQYKEYVFQNNYVFGTTDANSLTCIFSYSGTADEAEMDEMVINNNLFYNASNAGIMKFNKSVNVEARNNLIWVKEGTSYSNNSNGKLFGLKVAPSGSVAVLDNAAFGELGAGSWVIADSAPRAEMEALNVLTSDPVSSANVATGVFTLAAGYESYGPQGILP